MMHAMWTTQVAMPCCMEWELRKQHCYDACNVDYVSGNAMMHTVRITQVATNAMMHGMRITQVAMT